MNFETADNNIIVRGIKCLDLDLTLDCGQAFRWERQDDGSYKGVAMNHFLHIEKSGDDLIFIIQAKKFSMKCGEATSTLIRITIKSASD